MRVKVADAGEVVVPPRVAVAGEFRKGIVDKRWWNEKRQPVAEPSLPLHLGFVICEHGVRLRVSGDCDRQGSTRAVIDLGAIGWLVIGAAVLFAVTSIGRVAITFGIDRRVPDGAPPAQRGRRGA